MDYIPADEPPEPPDSPDRWVISIVTTIWLTYVLLLAVIDYVFVIVRPGMPTLPPHYYVLQAMIALLVSGLANWHSAQRWLGRAFLLTLIGCMTILPSLIEPLSQIDLPPGPITSPEGMTLRLMPVFCMALVLIAWHYDWRHVVVFSLGIAALGLLSLLIQNPLRSSASLVGVLIQTLCFFAIGYCICTLQERLRVRSAALRRSNNQLRHYASTLEQLTLSRERNRVARELHDTLAHTLSGLTIHLEMTRAYASTDPTTTASMIDTALAATRDGLNETRRALKALRARPLDDLGLAGALTDLAESASARACLTLDLMISEQIPALAPDVEQCIYRIAQEALSNIIYHANAQQLGFQLRMDTNHLLLVVSDDGCGFDPHCGMRTGHFGLAGMQERAVAAGGQFSIDSRLGAGTTIQLIF
jgi:signal transduction histidine kinase